MNGITKLRSYFMILLAVGLFCSISSSCQHKGILKCPKPGATGNSVELTGKNGQSMQAVSVRVDKKGRVKKKSSLKFW